MPSQTHSQRSTSDRQQGSSNDTSPMKIGIWGTGAMGSFAAWRLSLALDVTKNTDKNTLTVFGHYQPRLAHLNQYGINLIALDGHQRCVNVLATSNIPRHPELDVALIFNKTYQLDRVASEIHRSVKPGALVICFQNGLGSDKLLKEANPNKTIAPGVLFEGVTLDSTGDILHKGAGSTWLGLSPKVQARHAVILSLLRLGGFELRVQSDISSIQWSKLAANAAINPLTALTGERNKQVAEHPLLRNIAIAVATEITRVAEHAQIRRDGDYLKDILKVAVRTGENISSMLSDIQQGRQTEVQSINGAIVEMGKTHNIPTPVNEMLVELIERCATSRVSFEMLETRWQQLAATYVTEQ